MVDDLSSLIEDWPVGRAAMGVTSPTATLGVGGDVEWKMGVASVSKLVVGLVALVALEEESISLDEPAGPEGSTVRHLLSHASGLAFDDSRILAPPGKRRIYSNVGIEQFTDHLEHKTGMGFDVYLNEGVLAPLRMDATELAGSPAHGLVSTVEDLLLFSRELMAPSLIHAETVAHATSAHFPGLAGVLPGIGRFDPNPWGLTFELRGHKRPHWTGRSNAASTFGHFGGSGTFLWVDPEAGLGCVALTDRDFGDWALEVWPSLSDTVRQRYGQQQLTRDRV